MGVTIATRRAKLRDLLSLAEADLVASEAILRAELRSRHAFLAEMVEHAAGYQGKRVRPLLLFLVAKAVGSTNRSHHVLAAVVEMIHLATLVHDDLLDGAAVRRGRPSFHAAYGDEQTILFGDYLFTHSFHLAASLDSAEGCRLIGRATNRVCEGEMLQNERRGDFSLSREDYFAILRGKTAALLGVAALLGARFAGADESICRIAAEFGENMGVAFQIADDAIDVFGDPAVSGKPVGTDVARGQMTLPLIRLREVGSPEAVREAERLFAADRLRIETLLPLLAETDAREHCRAAAEEYAAKARESLLLLPAGEHRDRLGEMLELIVNRDV